LTKSDPADALNLIVISSQTPMPANTHIKIPNDIFQGLKYIERTKSIPYLDLQDSQATIQHAQTYQLTNVAHWIATHPDEYATGSRFKLFRAAEDYSSPIREMNGVQG
jgi:hypothetical protein